MNANSLTFRSLIRLAARLGLVLFLSAVALLLLIGLLGCTSVANADAVPLAWPRPAPLADPVPISETPLLTLTGEADDAFGISVASAGDVNGDGYADVIAGAPFYGSEQGRAYLYLGSAAGLSVTSALTLTGEAGNSFLGISVASAGDVNGDGFADILVGAHHYNSVQGRAYLYLGSGNSLAVTTALTLTGEATNNQFGTSVASAGDVNGDGFADVLIGACGYNSYQGRAYLYLGSAAGLTATPAFTLTGEAANNWLGFSVASAGDVNSDGFADVLVGAMGYHNNQGRAYLYLGSAVGLSATPALTLTGEGTGDEFGISMASAGDVNGDGFADVLVGAYHYNNAQGRAYLYLGNADGLTATPALTLTGEATNSRFGGSVASAGDVNKDGFADVLVGADQYNSDQGRAYLYLGNADGLSAIPALTLTGEAIDNRFGISVASAGDVNGDGLVEIIVGAHDYNSGQGRAYLYGRVSVPDLSVAQTAFPEPVAAGTSLTYTLVITNHGDMTATNVALTDALSLSATLNTVEASQGGCVISDTHRFTCALGSLAPGAVATIAAWVDVHPSALGALTNTAGVAATGEISPADNFAVITSTAVSEVRLHVAKYDDDGDLPAWTTWRAGAHDPVNAGSVLTYTLAVHNDGPSTAWAVVVTDTLPVSVGGMIAPAGWACDWVSETITCTAPALGRDDWAWIVITGTAPAAGGTITNTAWITARGSTVYATSQFSDTEATLVAPVADLSLVQSANVLTAAPGSPIRFTLGVRNNGPSPVMGAVTVTDTLPDGLTNVSATGVGWTCDTAALPAITCTANGLDVGPAPDILISVTVPSVHGRITNTAGIASSVMDLSMLNNTASASVEIVDMAGDIFIYLPIILRSHAAP